MTKLRRPHDVIAVPGGRSGAREVRRGPHAEAKWLTGSVARDAKEVIRAAFGQAGARDPAHLRTDGAAILSALATLALSRTVRRPGRPRHHLGQQAGCVLVAAAPGGSASPGTQACRDPNRCGSVPAAPRCLSAVCTTGLPANRFISFVYLLISCRLLLSGGEPRLCLGAIMLCGRSGPVVAALRHQGRSRHSRHRRVVPEDTRPAPSTHDERHAPDSRESETRMSRQKCPDVKVPGIHSAPGGGSTL